MMWPIEAAAREEGDQSPLAFRAFTGDTIEDVAQHLCRSGTIDDVRRKAEELGLRYRSREPSGGLYSIIYLDTFFPRNVRPRAL